MTAPAAPRAQGAPHPGAGQGPGPGPGRHPAAGPLPDDPSTGDRAVAERARADALARDAALGDRDAFAALVDLVGPGLFRYARRMLRDDGEAEDCTQETLVAAWLGLERFRGEASARTWMFGIQANMVRRRLRRRPAEPVDTAVVEPEPLGDLPVEHSLGSALRDDLDRALAELPAPQRAAWLLVAVEGLSYEEAARVQGTTVTALRGRLERGRATLGRRLAAWA